MASSSILQAHQWLLSLGYKFTSQSCGCGGKPVIRTYKTTENTIQIFVKNETFKINQGPVAQLAEIYTTL